MFHVVEPNFLRRATLGEQQDGGGDTGVGPEDARGHRDHAVETVLLDELLTDIDMSVGGTKEDAVRNDNGGASAILKQT